MMLGQFSSIFSKSTLIMTKTTITFVLSVFLITNLFIPTCHGGFLGLLGGSAACWLVCNAAYSACLAGGTGAAVAVTAGVATPAVIAGCTAAWTPCMTTCIGVVTAGTGPV